MPNEAAVNAAKEWIAGLSAEQQAEFKNISQAGLEYLGTGVLRQADYTKKTTELKADRDQLVQWREKANKSYLDMQNENVTLKGKVTETEARLKAIAEQYGVSEEEVKLQQEATGQGAEAAASAVRQQGGQAVDRQYIDNQMETAASVALRASDLAEDHRELFGSRLKVTEFMQEAIKAGKPLEEYWEEKFDVAAKRKEIEDKAKADWEAQIRRETEEQVRGKLIDEGFSLQPATSANLGKSPLFDPEFGKEIMGEGDSSGDRGSGQPTAKGRIDAVTAAVRRFETEGMARIKTAQEMGES